MLFSLTSIINIFQFRLPLAQLMGIIEEDDDFCSSIYPPAEDGNKTEADSDESDDEHVGDFNHLPREILNQPCEIVPLAEEQDYEPEDLIPLSELRASFLLY